MPCHKLGTPSMAFALPVQVGPHIGAIDIVSCAAIAVLTVFALCVCGKSHNLSISVMAYIQ